MRRAYPSFEQRHRAPCCNPLRLERLEDRLALSHWVVPLPYESVPLSPPELHFNDRVSNDVSVAVFAAYKTGPSPLDGSDIGRVVGGSVIFDGGPGSPLRPDLTDGFRTSERQITVTPSDPFDGGTALWLVLLADENFGSSDQPPDLHAAVAVHTDPLPPQSFVLPVDSRVAHVNEPIRTANAEGDQHFNQSQAVVAFSAESLIRASQTNGAASGENRTPAFVLPTVAPHVATSMNAPGDAGLLRIPSGLTIVPPQPADPGALQLPNSRVLKSDGDLGKPLGSNAMPNGDAVPPSSDGTAALGLAAGDPMGGEVATVMIASNRAALLASLPIQMEAVDQALVAMMNEVKGLGGELVTWLDDASVPPWVLAASLAGACGLGGRYLRRTRGRRSPQEESEDESSSWLFTRLQSPAGQL
jgi:hypothetical protein